MSEPRYRNLLVWQKAHSNVLLIIELLNKLPWKYSGIFQQCLGSASSIGANIAEGNEAKALKQKRSYLEIAIHSAYEFDNWLQVLKDSSLICPDKAVLLEIEQQNIEVIKILSKLIWNLNS